MPKAVVKTDSYRESLLESLKNPEEAAEYLNASLEDAADGADERFLMAFNQVAKAHGMTALSESGNPGLSTLKALLDAMGLKLAVEQKQKAS